MFAPDSVAGLLAAIASRKPIDARSIAVVVAHPDDETAGCGHLLGRLQGAHLLVATDGAPRDLKDARANGHGSAEAYAEARQAELRSAITLANAELTGLRFLGFPDQGLVVQLPDLVSDLREFVRLNGIDFVITQAYEGGHPDHDAVAFAARLAAPGHVIEMPFYRQGEAGLVFQSFAPGYERTEIVVRLHHDERDMKQRMLDAYSSQAKVLRQFSVEEEYFRLAPDYDFRAPPNAGKVFNESQPWGTDRDGWQAAVARVLEWA